MRALLIEDDVIAAESLSLALRPKGLVVDSTDLGEDGLEIGRRYDYDVILLDLMLPDINGHEVLRRLRISKVRTPVIVLSGIRDIDHRLECLSMGADDYLTKPFDQRELLARIHAIVRRAKGHPDSVIRVGELTVNLTDQSAAIGGRPLALTRKEFAVLQLMSLRKGMVISKDSLLNHLYGGIDEPNGKIVHVFVHKLRRKLEEASGGKKFITSIWGQGYVLRDPMERDETETATTPSALAS